MIAFNSCYNTIWIFCFYIPSFRDLVFLFLPSTETVPARRPAQRTERAVHPSIDGSALRMDATEEQDSVQAPDVATVVSDDDLEACLRVLRTLATPEGGVTEAYRAPRFKPLRKAQQVYLEELRGQLFHGHKPDKYRQGKEKKRG